MSSGITDYGLRAMLRACFRQEASTGFFVALVTDAVVPDASIENFAALAQIDVGNGYADGGYLIDADATGFPSLAVVSGRQVIEIKPINITASGGNIPASGDPAAYAVLLTNEATPSDRKVVAYWALSSPLVVTDGNTTGLDDLALRLAQE